MFINRNTVAQDATGEACGVIGQVFLSTGPGTSATFSAAGGATISIVSDTTVTWANAGTTLRVGFQGVNLATGLPDGTWSAYGDLVGGDGSVVINTFTNVDLTTGSITLAHGDLVCVLNEYISRAGSDSVRWLRLSTSNFPYGILNTGTGMQPSLNPMAAMLTADDGTLAVFSDMLIPNTQISVNINSGSTPDEYAYLFSLPVSATTNLLGANIGEVDSGEIGDLILYSDALGSPVALHTVAVEPDLQGTNASSVGLIVKQIPECRLEAGVVYGVAYRPTSTGNRSIQRREIGAGSWRQFSWPGLNQWGGTRTDQTGPFTPSDTSFAVMGCWLNSIDIPEKMPRTRTVRSL